MAMNEDRRLSVADIQSDRDTVHAIRELRDYRSINPAYGIDALTSLEAQVTQAQQEEQHLASAYAAARDKTSAVARALHNALLGAKAQVVAQYGPDSSVVQTVGLKKKSERKRRARRAGTAS